MKNLGQFEKVLPLHTHNGGVASQQYKIRFKNGWIFQSYDSVVTICNTKTNEITLGCDWDYSNTTRKYLYNLLGMDRKEILDSISQGKIKYDRELQ